MNFNKCIENISTLTDLKRFANEYVIDFRRLNIDELKTAVIKTAPQYYNTDNVNKTIDFFKLNPDRDIRVLFEIFVIEVLLNADDYTEQIYSTEDKILLFEQQIIDLANEYEEQNDNYEFFKYVLEAAWDTNDSISTDEQNLIYKIQDKFRINRKTYNIIEAKINKFPKPDNQLHTKDDISNLRRMLQQKGIVVSVRDSNGVDYDVIPKEIAESIRKLYGIDIKNHSFIQLLNSKYIKGKKYIQNMLEKEGINIPSGATLPILQQLALENLSAHKIIGGYSPNDGLDKNTLSDWCNSLSLVSYGTKPEMIERIIEYYDGIIQIEKSEETDERELYYQFFEELASRNLKELRKQNVIDKDLECERKFEQATNYLFEKKLKVKPLMMNGTEHADGTLSFNNKLILWDNKSKETNVNLNDHIKQFDRYISNSEKPVSVFMVIGPDFTEESAVECAKYSMKNDTLILLITASELKELADKWSSKNNGEESFPLGYFKQNGRFNKNLITF